MDTVRVCSLCGRYIPSSDWPCDICYPYDPSSYNHQNDWSLSPDGPGAGASSAEVAGARAYLLRRGVAIVAALPDRPPVKARLTTDHPLSQAGRPIVMVDYQSYSMAEVLWVDGSPWARQAAADAGYRVLPEADSTWPDHRTIWSVWFAWEEAEPQEYAR